MSLESYNRTEIFELHHHHQYNHEHNHHHQSSSSDIPDFYKFNSTTMQSPPTSEENDQPLSPPPSLMPQHQTNQKSRSHINARERNRTQMVNMAFDALRVRIPTEPRNKKLSKIEVLRLANSYIKHLDAVVSTGSGAKPCLYAYMNSCDANGDLTRRSAICTFCLTSNKSA